MARHSRHSRRPRCACSVASPSVRGRGRLRPRRNGCPPSCRGDRRTTAKTTPRGARSTTRVLAAAPSPSCPGPPGSWCVSAVSRRRRWRIVASGRRHRRAAPAGLAGVPVHVKGARACCPPFASCPSSWNGRPRSCPSWPSVGRAINNSRRGTSAASSASVRNGNPSRPRDRRRR